MIVINANPSLPVQGGRNRKLCSGSSYLNLTLLYIVLRTFEPKIPLKLIYDFCIFSQSPIANRQQVVVPKPRTFHLGRKEKGTIATMTASKFNSIKLAVLLLLCFQNTIFTVLRRYSLGVLKEEYSKVSFNVLGFVRGLLR